MQVNIKSHLEDYVCYLNGRDIPCDHQHLLLACMPKSGSTWLRTILSNLLGFESVSLVNGWDRREQELSEIQLLLCHRSHYVAQLHIRYSEPTAQLMQKFSLKPIVLVRNLFDIVPSIRDHLRRESVRGPSGYISPEVLAWTPDKIDEFIVEMVIPWYFNFFLCWSECQEKILVTYEEIQQAPFEVITTICHHFSIDVTPSQVTQAIALTTAQDTRKNKAQIGRGQAMSSATRNKIIDMAAHYDGVDFSTVGIPLADSQFSQGNIVRNAG